MTSRIRLLLFGTGKPWTYRGSLLDPWGARLGAVEADPGAMEAHLEPWRLTWSHGGLPGAMEAHLEPSRLVLERRLVIDSTKIKWNAFSAEVSNRIVYSKESKKEKKPIKNWFLFRSEKQYKKEYWPIGQN
jgi:hypothetical protein